MKEKVLRITCFLMLIIPLIFYSIWTSTLSIALVLVEYDATNIINPEFIMNLNKLMIKIISIELLIYSVLHLINYLLYMFKKDKILLWFIILDIVLFFVSIVVAKDFPSVILLAPAINGIIYLKLNKIK